MEGEDCSVNRKRTQWKETHKDNRINKLTPQNLLQPVPRTRVIPRLLQHNIVPLQRHKRIIQHTRRTTLRHIPQPGSHSPKRRLRPNLGPLRVGKVDAREDGERRGGLGVDGGDPGARAGDEGGAGGGGVDAADEGFDEVEVEDCVVGAEGEGVVAGEGARVGEVAGGRGCCQSGQREEAACYAAGKVHC